MTELFLRVSAAAIVLAATIILMDLPVLAIAQEEEVGNTGEEIDSESNNIKEEGKEMNNGDPVSKASEYIGIFALGTSFGLLISPSLIMGRILTTIPNLVIRNRIVLLSIATLSISVGIIHILLVKEHMEESYMWGIGFLVMGISQLIYGAVFVVLARRLERLVERKAGLLVLFGIGIIGNITLVAFFIIARVFVPPFSPEGRPVDELETNGIVTVIIELLIIGLLVYLAKGFSREKIIIDKKTRNMK
jgi:hypothetical protein